MDKLRACSDCRFFQEGMVFIVKGGLNGIQFERFVQVCEKRKKCFWMRVDEPKQREYIAICEFFRRKK